MRITFERSPILSAVSIANSVVPSRTPHVVLQNVLLSTAPTDGLLVIASDTEVTASIRVPCAKIDEPGEILLPASRFHSILRESRDLQLRILASDTTRAGGRAPIKLKSDGSTFDIPWADPSDFPRPAMPDMTAYHAVNAGKLRDAIQRTIVASDSENSRYALHAIAIEFDAEIISFVATDGRRACVAGVRPAGVEKGGAMVGSGVAIEEVGVATGQALLPQRAASIVARAFADSEAEVRISVTPNSMVFTDGTTTIVARQTEGRFPQWRQVIPNLADIDGSRAMLVSDVVLNAIRQSAVFADEESRGVSFLLSENVLSLNAQSETGKSSVNVPVVYGGDGASKTLDPRYVSDFLKSVPVGSTVILAPGEDETKAAFFFYGDESSPMEAYRGVVMPMGAG